MPVAANWLKLLFKGSVNEITETINKKDNDLLKRLQGRARDLFPVHTRQAPSLLSVRGWEEERNKKHNTPSAFTKIIHNGGV